MKKNSFDRPDKNHSHCLSLSPNRSDHQTLIAFDSEDEVLTAEDFCEALGWFAFSLYRGDDYQP